MQKTNEETWARSNVNNVSFAIHNSSSNYFSFKGKAPQNPAETISILFHIFLPAHFESSKLQGLRYYFPVNFRCNFKFYEKENFSDSSLRRIFESENFRFPFSTKNSLTWGLRGAA